MNRNLLSLSLAGNQVSDAGAKRLAEVLSRFPLSHEEVVERRKMLSGKETNDRKSVSVSTPDSVSYLGLFFWGGGGQKPLHYSSVFFTAKRFFSEK